MSEAKEPVTLEFLGARVAALTDEMQDMKLRFTAMEARFGAIESRIGGLETRFAAQEERQSRTLAILVRIAERLDGTGSPSGGAP